MTKSVTKLLSVVGCYVLLAAVSFPGPSGVSAVTSFETRCGWFDNPTPSNFWLYDRERSWTIGVQGGYQVEGDWDWPNFKPGQWVEINGHYGYGCVCMELKVNRRTSEVLEIKRSRARPLATCRRDQSLKKWRKMFR